MTGLPRIALDRDDDLFGGFDSPHHVQEITRVLGPHFQPDLPNETARSQLRATRRWPPVLELEDGVLMRSGFPLPTLFWADNAEITWWSL